MKQLFVVTNKKESKLIIVANHRLEALGMAQMNYEGFDMGETEAIHVDVQKAHGIVAKLIKQEATS